jgi:hypothetical protein
MAQASSIGAAISSRDARTDTVAHINLSPGQLTPPDPEREEEAFGMVSAHHSALQKLARYLTVALWEHPKAETWELLPNWYARTARLFEIGRAWLAFLIEAAQKTFEVILGYLYESHGLTPSISKPDKLSIKFVRENDNVARFLMRQKPRAIGGLTERINDETLSTEVRNHARHTLAIITGRRFQHYNFGYAKRWLTKYGA